MISFIKKLNPKTLAAILWLLTTLSLASWWMFFSLNIISQQQVGVEIFEAQRRMLFGEGAAWIVLLLTGGGFLIYYSQRENRRFNDFVKFISAYNHDAKTTLMNIMLQTERLADSGLSENQRMTLQRLRRSVHRLRTQIENSLYLSNQKEISIHSEKIDFSNFIADLASDYPQLNFEFEQLGSEESSRRFFVEADRKGLESIFRNLIENALQHGHASKVKISILVIGKGQLMAQVSDDGQGYKGKSEQLGQPFQSEKQSAGSGLGLYLVKYLSERMNGAANFLVKENNRLVVEILLRGQLS